MTQHKFIPDQFHGKTIIPFLFIGFFILQSLITSCENEASIIGEDLQPPSTKLQIQYLDTFKVNAYSFILDSIRTSNFSTALVGSMQDPVFGESRASFLTRVRLSGTENYPTPFFPGGNAIADSLILTLLPVGYYGDPSTQIDLEIYRLGEDILRDSLYYSTHVPVIDPLSLQSATFTVTDTLVRINLDTAFFGNSLSDMDTIKTNAELREKFKGLYVTSGDNPITGDGAIASLDILSLTSDMTIYYHNPGDTVSTSYTFTINSYSARANIFEHDYSSGSITSLNDTSAQDSLLFVQGMGGTYARLDFPFLEEFKGIDDIIVNNAEVSVKLWEYYDTTRYQRPEYLDLFLRNTEGEFVTFYDPVLGEEYFGGKLDEEEGTYTFTITNHIMDYFSEPITNSSVYIFIKGVGISPNRVVLYNSDSPNNIYFKLVYTKI